jgi:hypothetical protein
MMLDFFAFRHFSQMPRNHIRTNIGLGSGSAENIHHLLP